MKNSDQEESGEVQISGSDKREKRVVGAGGRRKCRLIVGPATLDDGGYDGLWGHSSCCLLIYGILILVLSFII